MSRSYQKWTAVGNVGKDPEIRSTTGGKKVAQLSFATSRRWTDARGEQQEKTEWHRVVAWNPPKGPQLADICEQYVRKGTQLLVEGRVEYRSYQGQDGQERWVTEIVATELLLLGSRSDRERAASDREPAHDDEDDEAPF